MDNGFIAWLERVSKGERKVRAVLRRSLSFEPGTFSEAFPYVEPFVQDGKSGWYREMHYLIAGLWAQNDGADAEGGALSLAAAFADYAGSENSLSTEKRFMDLLDADEEQLSHRLRQAMSLLKKYPIDFQSLLEDVIRWNYERKPTQIKWARDFYRKKSNDEFNNFIHETGEGQ
jgi:CRISPR system Cascade subunit CasB